MGVWDGNELVAAASYVTLQDRIASIGVLTHPLHRGKGHASLAISAISVIARDLGLSAQYQTLSSNIGAIKSAEKVGFRKFAETIAARITQKMY